MKSSKGQISMFIIISVIVVFSMVFLVFMSNDLKKKEISQGTGVDTQDRVLFIKEYVDSCMEKQLEKALIVSGLKGGFIYGVPNGTYRWSFIDPDPYPSYFIGNVDLDWNSLKWNLVHARELWIQKTVPYLAEDENRSIYNETVKSHFERYFFEEFGKNCQHNIERIEDLGFDFVNKDFSGKLELGFPVSYSQVIIKELDGEVGDRIIFNLDNKTYTGTINETQGVRRFNVELDPGQIITPSGNSLDDVSVYNLNSTATVNVSFNKDETEVKFLYSIVLNGSRGDSVEFVESVVSVPVRLRALKFLSEGLMVNKTNNRSINLSNSTQLNGILGNISKSGGRAFIDNLSELTFKIHKINDSPEYKEYVYYFFDDGSKILGNPYVYRFGYQNHAPIFNLSVLCTAIVDDRCILAYTSDSGWSNSTIDFKARMDPEITDCSSGDCSDVRYIDLDPDDTFTLLPNGTYSFKVVKEGISSYDIQLSDGEAYTTQTVFFIAGTPRNRGNNDVADCLRFYSYDKPGFPIDVDLFGYNPDTDEGRIFPIYNNTEDRTTAFAYALYPGKYAIKVTEFCIMTDANEVTYWIDDGFQGSNSDGFIGPLNTTSTPFEIKIQINPISHPNSPINDENYTLTVYPFRCLGPRALPGGKLGEENWFMTCCNTEILNKSINHESIRSSLVSNSRPHRYFKDGGGPNEFALNEDVYFCYDPYVNSQKRSRDLGYDRNFHSQNIFDYLSGSEITSLLKARVQIKCDGTSAVGNLTSIRGSSPLFPFQHVIGFGYDREIIEGLVNPDIGASFNIVRGASMCQFCHIPNSSNFVIELSESRFGGGDKPDSLILTTGLVRHNSHGSPPELGTLGGLSQRYDDPSDPPIRVRFNKTQVRCNTLINEKFGCADDNHQSSDCFDISPDRWLPVSVGVEFLDGQVVWMGEKFCRLDRICGVRKDFVQSGNDIKYSCTDSSENPKNRIKNCLFNGNEITCTESDCL